MNRPAWVRYHVENYLNELYIFQNRVEALLTLLRRGYRKQTYSAALDDQCDLLEEALRDAFAGVMKARGSHVHENRFEDTSLRILSLKELLAKRRASSARDYRETFLDTKTEKVLWMMRNNASIRKWLDECGISLGRLLFAENGTFRLPSPP
jgi:hypothetical protein